MEKTTFAGLTILAPGESLGEDGYSFQAINPDIIDRLLRVGVISHRHDGHVRLSNPLPSPSATVDATGGTLPADTAIYLTYTLIDGDGGETLPTLATVVSTDPGLTTPNNSPTLELDHLGGDLSPGSYNYAVTVTDGFGGETIIGPSENVIIDPGNAVNEVVVSGLVDIVDEAIGDGWKLYRSIDGSPWGLVTSGTADSVTDDGSLCVDCQDTPPLISGTTNGTNKLLVTVPAGQPAGTVSIRLYASLNGDFATPALLDAYMVSETGTVHEYTTLALGAGAPPDVSLALPGAHLIDPEFEIEDFTWRRPVTGSANLPGSGNRDGDVRVTKSDRCLHIWSAAASAWGSPCGTGASAASGAGGLSPLSWTAVSFGASAANQGGGFGNCEWTNFNGLIFLRGLVSLQSGYNEFNPVFTLPVGARPAAQRKIEGAVYSGATKQAVMFNIGTNGQFKIDSSGGASTEYQNTNLPLDGICFSL